MGSGRKLTKSQVATILRLAGETRADGKWAMTYQQIAQEMELHRVTVSCVIRGVATRCRKCYGGTVDKLTRIP